MTPGLPGKFAVVTVLLVKKSAHVQQEHAGEKLQNFAPYSALRAMFTPSVLGWHNLALFGIAVVIRLETDWIN
jgi:hypothetical protein